MPIKAVADFDKVDLHSARSCSTCVDGRVPNKAIKSRTTLEMGPDVILLNDVTKMSLPSVGGALCFVTFIDEAPRNVNAFHTKTKSNAAKLLRCQIKWMERQTESKVKKVKLDGGREYLIRCNKLDGDGTDITTAAYYMSLKNGHADYMNRTLKKAHRTILNPSVTLANL